MVSEEKTVEALQAVDFGETHAPAPALTTQTAQVGYSLNIERLKELSSIAKSFAQSQMVADCYRGGGAGVANAYVALVLGDELGINPFQALNHIVVIKGRPAIDGQLAIALANTRAPIKGVIRYDETGKGDDMACTAWAIDSATGERVDYSLSLKDAKEAGWLSGSAQFSIWKKVPKLMLRYRSATYLVRTYYPNVMMGLLTKEEVQDIGTVEVSAEKDDVSKQLGLSSKKESGS